MYSELKEALVFLGFKEINHVPKLKDITKMFNRLALKLHPYKNNGSKEATALFQQLLSAYEIAGRAAENVTQVDVDEEELIARKIFKLFSFSSVRENNSSVTIKTEKSLHSTWCLILQNSFGLPVEMGIHGKKFTMTDTCDNLSAKTFITIYQTGKVLIQGEGSRHSLNLHFVSHHLEELYLKVYNRRLQSSKTPLTKPVGRSKSISKTYICHKCDHKFTDVAAFYNH